MPPAAAITLAAPGARMVTWTDLPASHKWCPVCGRPVLRVDALEHTLNCTDRHRRRTERATLALAADPDRRTWDIPLAELDGYRPLSANHRGHWSIRQRETRRVRQAAGQAIRSAHVPPLPRVDFTVTSTPPDRRRRDEDNLTPFLLKPAKDALVDCGVVPDDTSAYCRWAVVLDAPDGVRRWRHRIRIRELDAE